MAKLAEAGYNGRETAVIQGVSKQRVSQLVGEPRGRAKSGSGGGRITTKGDASAVSRTASRGALKA